MHEPRNFLQENAREITPNRWRHGASGGVEDDHDHAGEGVDDPVKRRSDPTTRMSDPVVEGWHEANPVRMSLNPVAGGERAPVVDGGRSPTMEGVATVESNHHAAILRHHRPSWSPHGEPPVVCVGRERGGVGGTV